MTRLTLAVFMRKGRFDFVYCKNIVTIPQSIEKLEYGCFYLSFPSLNTIWQRCLTFWWLSVWSDRCFGTIQM
jgi:hypothetical protein